MSRLSARVLSLPTEADLRDEAARVGVPAEELSPLLEGSGGMAVKLSGVSAGAAGVLVGVVAAHHGLGLRYAPRGIDSSTGDQSLPHAAEEGGELGQDALGNAGVLGAQHGTGRRAKARKTRRSQPASLPLPLEDPAIQPAPETVEVLLSGPRGLLMEAASRLEREGGKEDVAAAHALRTVLERYAGRELTDTTCGDFTFRWGSRTYVMGILNATPDSFSGDGLGTDLDAALEQARRFVEAGADILDVGGESTRPGHQEVSAREERDRVVPVIQALAREFSVPISIDSYKMLVVQEALEAGATMINDVWGLRRTEGLASLAAAYDAPIILMHNRRAAASRTELGGHFQRVEYHDLMGQIVEELEESIGMALRANVKREKIIVDPGVGFGKTPEQNLVVLRRLKEVRSLGLPILMGTSRKSMIGLALGLPAEDRVEGTGATVAVSICNGADIVRVHDVKQMCRVARMTDAIVRGVISD